MTSKTITVGSVAYDPKVVTIWEGIKQFFNEHGCALDYVLFSNYEAQVQALLDHHIDIAWNTNLAYVCADLQLNGKAKLLAMRDTDLGFSTVIIAGKDANISNLKDLKGKKIAFGSRDSAQAAVIPEFYLLAEGLVADKDYQALRFNTDVGKHGDTGNSEREVIAAVLSGAAAAGAIGHFSWQQLEKTANGAKLASVWSSPPYSHCCFTALPDFSEQLAENFVATLMKMDYNNEAHRKILEMEGLKEWVLGDRQGYETVFNAVQKTGYLNRKATCLTV